MKIIRDKNNDLVLRVVGFSLLVEQCASTLINLVIRSVTFSLVKSYAEVLQAVKLNDSDIEMFVYEQFK